MCPLSILSGAWGLIKSPIGKLVLIGIVVAGLWARGSHYQHQRDALQGWQNDVTQATRDAAHRPKLAVRNVAVQVRYLGSGLDAVRAAMVVAKAEATESKLLIDHANEQRKRDADYDLQQDAIADNRRTDAYRRAHGVRRAGAPQVGSPTDRDNSGQGDLPRPAFAAQEPDGPGGAAAMDDGLVAITSAALDLCTTNTRRLSNGHEWAIHPPATIDTKPQP